MYCAKIYCGYDLMFFTLNLTKRNGKRTMKCKSKTDDDYYKIELGGSRVRFSPEVRNFF